MEQASVSVKTVSKSNIGTYLLLICTTSFWGSAFVSSKIAVGIVPPSVAAFIRFGIGAVFAFMFLFVLHKRDRSIVYTPKGAWTGVLLLGIVGVALYNLLFFWGLAFSKASDGSMIIPTLSPAITLLLASIIFKEKIRWQQYAGFTLTLTGSFVFFSSIGFIGLINTDRIIGDLFFLTAAATWSAYTLLGKKFMQKISPLVATAYAMLFGSIILGIVVLPEMKNVHWSSLGTYFWLNQIYLALFPSVLANWFFYLGVQNLGPAKASSLCISFLSLD